MIDGLYKSDILTSVSRDSPCHEVNRRFYAVVTPSTAPSSATPLSRCLVLSLWSCDGVLMLWCTQPTKHQLERCSLFWCPNAPKMDINTVQRSLTCNPATLHLSFWVVTLPLKICDRGINLQRKFILFRQILSKSFWLIGEDQDLVPLLWAGNNVNVVSELSPQYCLSIMRRIRISDRNLVLIIR